MIDISAFIAAVAPLALSATGESASEMALASVLVTGSILGRLVFIAFMAAWMFVGWCLLVGALMVLAMIYNYITEGYLIPPETPPAPADPRQVMDSLSDAYLRSVSRTLFRR